MEKGSENSSDGGLKPDSLHLHLHLHLHLPGDEDWRQLTAEEQSRYEVGEAPAAARAPGEVRVVGGSDTYGRSLEALGRRDEAGRAAAAGREGKVAEVVAAARREGSLANLGFHLVR